MNSYHESAIKWTEPCVDADSGQWKTVADGLNARTKFILSRLELCAVIEEEQFAARVTFNKDYVAMYGAHRCWWFLREMVTEAPALLSPMLQAHMNAALERAWPEDDGGWDNDDLGDLGWGRLDLIN